jgi:DNA-binding CsgD family transcriptional regulator
MWQLHYDDIQVDLDYLVAKMKYFLSSLWRGLLSDLGLLSSSRRIYQYDAELFQAVRDLAIQEQRSEEEVTAELLSMALVQKDANEEKMRYWHSLSHREQQVATLACLNHTNRQIAARLGISPATVATHMRNVLYKFNLRSKSELRQALSHWDFSAWNDGR